MASPHLGPSLRTRPRLGLHVGLLLATLASTGLTYFAMWGGQQEAAAALLQALLPGGASPAQAWAELSAQVPLGEMVRDAAVFALSLCGVLGAHEMGHYALARRHGVDTTLPYFLPLPLLGTGTLGAVIRLRGRIPSRNALVDIGAAGPLAGLVVALPLLGWGLVHSRVVPAVVAGGAGAGWPGPSSLWALGGELLAHLAGRTPEAGADSGLALVMFADNLFMVGVERLVLGARAAGTDLVMHPRCWPRGSASSSRCSTCCRWGSWTAGTWPTRCWGGARGGWARGWRRCSRC